MNNFCKVVLLCATLNGALAVDFLDETLVNGLEYTNLENEVIKVSEYCKDKPCIVKCCGENEILLYSKVNGTKRETCIDHRKLNLNDTGIVLDYSDLIIYEADIQTNVKETKKRIMEDFKLVQNKVFLNESVRYRWHSHFKPYILENGQFAADMKSLNSGLLWNIKEALTFCVERKVGEPKKGPRFVGRYSFYLVNSPLPSPENLKTLSAIDIFIGTGMLISSFFLLLVLLIYCMLPKLQNLPGMLLMAYMLTLGIAYILKAVYIFSTEMDSETCEIISPITYFFFLSSFFWLNTISINTWKVFRSVKESNKQQERRYCITMFLWYALYAWGVAAFMTLAAVLIDKADLTDFPSIVKPSFHSCFYYDDANNRYLYAPTGIITMINIVLFAMTAYKIWETKKTIVVLNSNAKKKQNRFRVYFSMSLMMGLSWALEVVQAFYKINTISIFIIFNLYNIFIGVAMFYMFIFKMSTYNMLRKRFYSNKKSTMSNLKTKSGMSKSQSFFFNTKNDETEMTNVSSISVVK